MAYALITGASGGIGKELAKQFANGGFDLILVARNETALHELKLELEANCGIHVLCLPCDLTSDGAANALLEELQKQAIQVSVLVNNAGFGDSGAFLDADWNKQKNMVRLNILTLMEMTYLFGNEMRKQGYGRILNLSSVAAFSSGPYMSIYYASKAFVLSFSESVHRELAGSGVTVTALCPGPTRTGFEAAAGMGKESKMFRLFPQSAEQVAKAGYRACMKGKAVRYHSPVTYGYNVLSRLLPRSATRSIAASINHK